MKCTGRCCLDFQVFVVVWLTLGGSRQTCSTRVRNPFHMYGDCKCCEFVWSLFGSGVRTRTRQKGNDEECHTLLASLAVVWTTRTRLLAIFVIYCIDNSECTTTVFRLIVRSYPARPSQTLHTKKMSAYILQYMYTPKKMSSLRVAARGQKCHPCSNSRESEFFFWHRALSACRALHYDSFHTMILSQFVCRKSPMGLARWSAAVVPQAQFIVLPQVSNLI